MPTEPVPSTNSPVVPFGDSWIGPVELEPMVNGAILVVVIVGAEPEKARLPAVVAVPVSPKTWKRAEEVAVPPTNRSSVMFVGANATLFICQYPEVPVTGA